MDEEKNPKINQDGALEPHSRPDLAPKPEPEPEARPEAVSEPKSKQEPEPKQGPRPEAEKKTSPAQPDFHKIMDSMFVLPGKSNPSDKGQAVKNSLFAKTDAAIKGAVLKEKLALIPSRFRFGKTRPVVNTGLDIGISAVKCATFSCVNSAYKLVNLDIEEIPHENFESASRTEAIKDNLKKLRSRHALEGKLFVSTALPNMLVEFMYLPMMPPDELDKAIRWEAKEKLLIDEANYAIDYLVLGEENVSQQAHKRVLFFGAPRKDILDNYDILSSLGLQPQAIRPGFLAAFQAFEDKTLWREDEAVGFLDIGAGTSQFSIICRGYVNFNRRFNVSGDSTTRSIADYCRVSYEEAERAKRMFGMSKMALEEDRKEGGISATPPVRISHAIGLHMDQLITEMQHTFSYFSLEVSNTAINKMDRLILTGGGASMSGICDFFKSRLNLPVETVNPFNYIESELKDGDQKQLLLNEGARFAATVGLATRV